MIIAIDGPAGSGKSTTAKEVASQLNIMHLDTGAMYRAVALYLIENKILNLDMLTSLEWNEILSNIDIKFSFNSNQILLNGNDVSRRIRETEVSEFVSEVSAVSIVREKMVNLQREIAAGNNVVLEGRDIGTRVFPNADFKFFLNADVKVRGKRRYKELVSRGEIITLNQVIKKIELRDLKDSTRKHSPLEKAKNSIEIDTSNMSIKTQVEKIVSLINNNK